MKLSIVTINLNNKDGLQKTIDSVVSQTFRDFEWIVIDGGSTDGSKELIEQYADYFSYWVSEPDKGIYNAMNKGIKVAKGEYLQFLNSGDWLVDETALERCFSHGFTADIAYGDLYYYNGEKLDHTVVYPELLTLRLFYQRSIGHPSSFIRNVLLQDSLYNESYKIVSDWEFFLKQAFDHKVFEHINEFVVCYNMDGISSTSLDLAMAERKKVIIDCFPEMLITDYNTMDEWENHLKNKQVMDVLEYGGKSRFYHKMITVGFILLRYLDRMMNIITRKNSNPRLRDDNGFDGLK